MPRTPLLKAFARLARDHRRAEETGLPVDVVRQKVSEAIQGRAISRRAVLQGAAGAAAATGVLLPNFSFAQGQPRISIIGAGIAGMATALKLADNGIQATVYEAGGRIGGRMFSNTTYFDQGQVFEWCGELIDTNHATIRRFADRFGLSMDDLRGSEPAGTNDTFYFNGQFYPKHQADADFKNIMQPVLKEDIRKAGYPTDVFTSTAHGRMLDQMSVYDYIESRIPGGHSHPLGELLDTAYYIEYNSDTRDQSALNILYLLAYQPNWNAEFEMFGLSDETFHVRGGNQQIPVKISEHLGADRNKKSQFCESIKKTPAGTYDLTFTGNGTTTVVNTDIVVCCLPFAVLRTIDTSQAGFNELKQFVISNLGAGRQSKQHLQFTRRVWNEQNGGMPEPGNGSSYGDTGYQSSWETTRGQPGTNGILVGYAGGPFADAMSSHVAFATATSAQVRQDAERFLGQIEPVYPGLSAAWNGKSTQGLPHLDPYMKCSYSYFRVGQYQTIGAYERVRQGNVFFAGEHCSMDFQGFMEGGAVEGERAATEILTQLGIRARK
jgi:monoamine oxidase